MPDVPVPPAVPLAAPPAEEQRFSVFDPDSASYVTVPQSELAQAADYYGAENIESPEQTAARHEREQYDTLGETARAGAEGFARGATLGGYDFAAEQLGADTAAMERRQRLNPMVSGAGEIAGTIAPALLTGGGSLAEQGALKLGARAATAPAGLALRAGAGAEALAGAGLRRLGLTGESTLGRMALRGGELAAGGATEGALFSGGQALSEQALSGGDYDSLGEKMLQRAGSGGMFGALAGGALGGTLGLGSRAVELAGGRARKALTLSGDAANEQALRALNVRPSDVAKLGPKKAAQIGEDLRTLKLNDGTDIIAAGDNSEQVAAKIKIAREERGKALGDLRQTVEDAKDAIDATVYLKNVEKDVLRPLRESPSPTIRSRAKDVELELADLKTRNDGFHAAQERAGSMAKRVDAELVEPLYKSKSARIQAKAAELRQQLGAFQEAAAAGKVTPDMLRDMTDGVLLPLVRSPSSAIRKSAKLAIGEAELMAKGMPAPITFSELRAQQNALKEIVYPKKLPGQGLPPAPPQHAQYLQRAERLLEDTMEKHVETTLARVAPEEAGQYATLRRQYESLRKADQLGDKIVSHAQGLRIASPSDMGTALATAAGSLAAGPGGGLLALAKGAAAGAIHREIRTRGNSFLVALSRDQAEINAKISQSIKKFVSGAATARRVGIAELSEGSASSALGQRRGETKLKAFERVRAAIEKASVPDRMAADVEAPETAKAARATAQRAISFLQSKLPLGGANTNPLVPPLEPHPSEIDKFARYYRATNHPQSVLYDLKHGDVSAEAVEALKHVWPKTYDQIANTVSAELIARGSKSVPYEKRISIGSLLGIEADRALSASAIQGAQASFNAAPQQPKAPQQIPPAKPVAGTYQSESERLEAGDMAI
jgi:hypothetical protein